MNIKSQEHQRDVLGDAIRELERERVRNGSDSAAPNASPSENSPMNIDENSMPMNVQNFQVQNRAQSAIAGRSNVITPLEISLFKRQLATTRRLAKTEEEWFIRELKRKPIFRQEPAQPSLDR